MSLAGISSEILQETKAIASSAVLNFSFSNFWMSSVTFVAVSSRFIMRLNSAGFLVSLSTSFSRLVFGMALAHVCIFFTGVVLREISVFGAL